MYFNIQQRFMLALIRDMIAKYLNKSKIYRTQGQDLDLLQW